MTDNPQTTMQDYTISEAWRISKNAIKEDNPEVTDNDYQVMGLGFYFGAFAFMQIIAATRTQIDAGKITEKEGGERMDNLEKELKAFSDTIVGLSGEEIS